MPRFNCRLCVICPKKGSYFFDKVFEGTKKAEKELEQFGVQIEYLYTEHHSLSRQVQFLTQVIDLRPDGIAIVPASTTELNYIIDDAVDNNIPIVTFNNDAPYSKRFCYVGPDNYSSGRLCGELMGNFLSSAGNVIIFSASSEVYGLKQRLLGFRDKLRSSYPNIKIKNILDYSDDEEICYSNAINELSNNTEIDGIFTTSATGSVAVGKALKELNLPSLPKVIGYDPNELASKYLLDNTINVLIHQDPITQGYLSIKVLYDYLSSGIIPPQEHLYTKIEIVMQENLASFMKENM